MFDYHQFHTCCQKDLFFEKLNCWVAFTDTIEVHLGGDVLCVTEPFERESFIQIVSNWIPYQVAKAQL